MYKVILDCDNTMGIKRSDIDDGLTFAYLYAHPEVELLGITCTFANNHAHIVYYNTIQMLEDLNITDVPVFKGGRKPGDYDSDAVDFLLKAVSEQPGEIVVIAIGSMCNIAGAYKKDSQFFEKIDRLILMGGVLEPLYMNGVLCKELNFSVDYQSAASVIYNCPKLSIMSSQCTQDAVYGQKELDRIFALDNSFIHYAMPIIKEWIDYIGPGYGNRPVFINWDLCAAVYVLHPEWFEPNTVPVVKNADNLKTGWIQIDESGEYPDSEVNLVDIPTRILDVKALNEDFYVALRKLG